MFDLEDTTLDKFVKITVVGVGDGCIYELYKRKSHNPSIHLHLLPIPYQKASMF